MNEVDIAANLTIFNVSMSNSGTGARIKVWPGVQSSLGQLNGGGGSGYVNNVTYQGLTSQNVDYAIQINQLSHSWDFRAEGLVLPGLITFVRGYRCYGQSNATLCELYPVSFRIEAGRRAV